MSTPEDLRDWYELYALGVLEEPEKSQIQEALRSGSEEARNRLKSAMENNAIVIGAVPLVDPPKRLRKRVLASVGVEAQERKSRGWIGILAAACAALVVA